MKRIVLVALLLTLFAVSFSFAEETQRDILNAENCPSLATILTMDDPDGDAIVNFASKYSGERIEFDGYISRYDTAFPDRTRYDITVRAGDKSDASSRDTAFLLKNISLTELGYSNSKEPPAFIVRESNVHVIGTIVSFDSFYDCIIIDVELLEKRNPLLVGLDASSYSILERGSKGDSVKVLQQRLIDLLYLDDKADGSYGSKTKAAVEKFQNATDLDVTGVADPMTQALLFSDKAPEAKLNIARSTLILGSSATTSWSVDGQEFTLRGNQTKTIKTVWGTYKFDAFGEYELVGE